MQEWVSDTVAMLQGLPRDVWALLILMVGLTLSLTGHKDEGMLTLGGALAVFRGDLKR